MPNPILFITCLIAGAFIGARLKRPDKKRDGTAIGLGIASGVAIAWTIHTGVFWWLLALIVFVPLMVRRRMSQHSN